MVSITANYSPVANYPLSQEAQQLFHGSIPKNEQSTAQSQKAAVELLATEWEKIDKVKAENINNEFDEPIADDILDTVFESNTVLQSQKAGKTLYNINGNIITFSDKGEFDIGDMSTGAEYSLDNITETKQYDTLSESIDLKLLSSAQLYKLFASIAPSLDIDSHRISKSFFMDNNEEAQNLLKILRIITKCEGKLPIKTFQNGQIGYIMFGEDACEYFQNKLYDETQIIVPLGK